MLKIMSDNDVLGQFNRLVRICQSPEWADVWEYLKCQVCTFAQVGLAADSIDAEVWEVCQEQQIMLVTGNRSADEPDSLEVALRSRGCDADLPVITLSDPARILLDAEYAEQAAEMLLQIAMDAELLRGTGRMFIP